MLTTNMHFHCAVCGETPAVRTITSPFDWTNYLRTKRNLEPPTWSYRIPVCSSCAPDVESLRDQTTRTRQTTDSPDASTERLLDDITLDSLVDASPHA